MMKTVLKNAKPIKQENWLPENRVRSKIKKITCSTD